MGVAHLYTIKSDFDYVIMADPAAATTTTDSAADAAVAAAEAAIAALNFLDPSEGLSAAHMEFHKKLDALPDLSTELRRELEAHTLKYATELDDIVENFHYRNYLGWRRR